LWCVSPRVWSGLTRQAVYQSLLRIPWIDKLLENVKALFTELYRNQLSPSRGTSKIDCPFDPYFDRQIAELERTSDVAAPDHAEAAPPPQEQSSFPASSQTLAPGTDSSRPASPANHLLTAKNFPGGRGSRRGRKAAAAAVTAASRFAASSGDESPSQKSKPANGGKKMRRWGADGVADDGEDVRLDFSSPADNEPAADASTGPVQEIDQASWGTRTTDGKFMLKDIGDEMNAILDAANQKKAESKPTGIVGSSLGAIGGLFRNVVGGKTLTKEELSSALNGMEDHLMRKNVAREAALRLCSSVERDLVGMKTDSFTSK
jgi:signal recognition particle receptor subunit alpha